MKNWIKKLPFALVRIGKEKKWLKYPVILLLAIMFAVCEISDAVKTLAYPQVRRRILASALACCMVFTMMPTAAFAVESVPGMSSVCTHHTEHTPECGYTEGTEGTPCGFISDAPEEASPSDAVETETEPTAHIHNEECGYIEEVEGTPCAFVCDVCNQAPEQGNCNCPPVDSGKVTHGEDCSLYLPTQSDCICPPVDSGEVTHGTGCPLYEKLVTEQADAVKNVLALIGALPTMEELTAQDTEGAGFADYLAKLRLDTAAARAAYNALTAEQKAELDPAVLAKLTELEEVLAAMPVLMSDAIPTLDTNSAYQNVKYTLTAGSSNTATVSGVMSKTAVTGVDNVLTIPAQVQKGGTTYNVTAIESSAFSNCTLLTSISFPEVTSIGSYAFQNCRALTTVEIPQATSIGTSAFSGCMLLATASFPKAITIGTTAFQHCSSLAAFTIPSTVTTIGASAFSELKSGAVITLERTDALPSGITSDSFKAALNIPCYVVANDTVAAALGDLYANNTVYAMIVSTAPVNPSLDNTNDGGTLRVRAATDPLAMGIYDVVGLKDNNEILTTYSGTKKGYYSYLCIGNSPTQAASSLVRLPSTGVESYVKGGIWAKVDTEFVSDGKYLRITYTMRNSTATTITNVALGVNADVQIGADDYASIFPTATGFRMVNKMSASTDPNGNGMQFTLNCKDATGVDNVDTMWYGNEYEKDKKLFTNLANKEDLISADSGLAFSWKNMTIPANGEITRSVVFGVGEAAAPPALPTDGSKPIALYLTTEGQKDITVNAKVTDTTGVTDTLYYTINDGAEQQLGETVTANGSEQVISGNIAASNFTDDGEYTVKLWIMNSKGAMSEVITKVLTVSSGAMGGAGLESGTAPVVPGGGGGTPTDAITITINDTSTEYGGETLQAAIDTAKGAGGAYTDIKKLTVTKGEVTTADWTWFANNDYPKLGNMTDFTVENGVTAVAGIPARTGHNSTFPTSIVNVTIPQEITIGVGAFYSCNKLTNVSFPAATSIGAGAFYECKTLVSVSFSAATSIGEKAFERCKALETASFPVVTTIGKSAFLGCTALTTANFPAATSIGNYAFNDCKELTTANFPKTTDIGIQAFCNCAKLATLKLGATVPTTVGDNAFLNCPKTTLTLVDESGNALTESTTPTLSTVAANYDKVVSPDTGTDTDGLWLGWKVREAVAAVCTCALSVPTFAGGSIVIPANQASTTYALQASGSALSGSCAVAGHGGETVTYTYAEKTDTSNIATVTGTTLTVTGAGSVIVTATAAANGKTATKDSTFTVTKAVAESKITIKINDASTEHGGATLNAAVDTAKGSNAYTTITKLTITKGEVTADDWTWFKGNTTKIPVLTNLTDFTVESAVTAVADIPDGAYNKPIFSESIVNVSIPQVITIGNYAFYGCAALTTASFPAATKIRGYAFYNCANLSTVNIPKATSIGAGAFNDCTALTIANFPTATSIGVGAFIGCTLLATASFPAATSIEREVFAYCTSLATLKLGTTPPTMGTDAFTDCPKTTLTLVNASGNELTGDTLTTAQTNYDKVADGESGSTTTDGKWYGWKIGAPVAAAEAEWTPTGGVTASGTLVDGFAALKTTGGTIKLVDNITKTENFDGIFISIDGSYTKPITFDLAGKKLAFTGGDKSTALIAVYSNAGLLTITDSSVEKNGGISMVNSFTLFVDPTAKLALTGGSYAVTGKIGDNPVSGAIAATGSDTEAGNIAALKAICSQGFGFSPDTISFDGETFMATTATNVSVVPDKPIAVTGVTLNKTTLSLAAGKSETLVATIAPATATNKAVTWQTSNAAVATVTDGVVSALTAGTATITVTTTDGGKKATCAVTVTAATSKPAPGGKLEAPLTQEKVDAVFGEGNATLDDTTTPPTIKLEKDITPEKPIEIETDVKIDLGGNTITGKPGQPPIIVGDNDKVVIDGSGTIAGGDSTTGTGGNGITGGTGSDITIGADVVVSGGDGTTGGDGINSGGKVIVDGTVQGGNGTSGNHGGDGVDTSTGSGTITIENGGSASGGNGGNGSAGTGGNGGNGTISGSGSTTVDGETTGGSGGTGTTGGGSGGDGSTSTGGGSITVDGETTGGTGGNASSGTGGNGGDGSETSGNTDINSGGSSTGGTGGNGATGGNGGDGADSGTITIDNGGTANGGNGGIGTGTGGNGGDGSNSSGKGDIDGSVSGGDGGSGGSTGGNGGNGASSGSGSNAGDIDIGGTTEGGNGGTGGTTGGTGGNGTTTGGDINVAGGGSSTGGNGGSSSTGGGNGGNGTNTSGGGTTVNGGTTGGAGGNGNGNGSGGNGGNGANQGSGTVGGNGDATGGDGGNGAGTGNGGTGGAGVGGGAGAGSVTNKPGANGRKATAEVDDSKAGTTVKVPDESKLADAALTEAEKNDPAITEVKVVLNVEKKNNQPDKAEIDRVLSSEAADTIGAFFDITLDKIITNAGGAQPPVGVANASEEIEITITIPSDMRGGSNYVVIRVHNGTGAALATTQSGDDLTFKTDKFSTYAIAYTKAGGTTPPTPPIGGGDDNSGGGSSYTYYYIKATADIGGSMSTAERVKVRAGESAGFTITPDKGYQIADVLVNGKSIGAKNYYAFTNVWSDQTIHAIFKKVGHQNPQTGVDFDDVSENDWFYDAVMTATAKGWFMGTTETTFSPNSSTTRGMIATILHRMAGSPSVSGATFGDVATGTWYADAIAWAQANGIVTGYDNGSYGPDDNITREQLTSILFRYAKHKGYDVSKTAALNGFTDGETVSTYAKEAMSWAVGSGLISGRGNNTLAPTATATRAEVAVILVRFEELFTK